jgi:hypothetical protein
MEKAITTIEAARLWARLTGGHRPHHGTIRRWISVGVGGMRLKGIRSGSTWLTTEPALRDFFDQLQAGLDSPHTPALDARATEAAAEVDELLASS